MKKIKQNFKDIDWELLGGPYSITSMVLKYGKEDEKKGLLKRMEKSIHLFRSYT